LFLPAKPRINAPTDYLRLVVNPNAYRDHQCENGRIKITPTLAAAAAMP
jgi:hypothetical protein